jgi:hypothetical protein
MGYSFRTIWWSIIKFLKYLFKHKKRPLIKISVLILLLSLCWVSTAPAQRLTVQSVYVYFNQQELSSIDYWTVAWSGIDNGSSILDTTQASVYDPLSQSWVNFLSSADSVRLLVMSEFAFKSEYTFSVTAHNTEGDSTSIPVNGYFIASDIDLNNAVDGLDLIQLSLYWGRTGLSYRDFVDINGDTYVDGLDLIQLSLEWGIIWIP